MRHNPETKIGVVGTGFIADGLISSLREHPNYRVSRVLTRRPVGQVNNLRIDSSQITNSYNDLIDHSNLVIECSGDPIYATDVVYRVLQAGKPVITMDSELQVTSGSWLASQGYLTESQGDQPGSLAALDEEVRLMGFKPLVYGNIKGFLSLNPPLADMEYWAKKQGISVNQVTSFTDGTKIQIEQTLVANGLKAEIAKEGLIGPETDLYKEGALKLAEQASSLRTAISDYVLSKKAPAGVFIVATHQQDQNPFLRYYKMGEGPYYIFERPYHLCHLEIPLTIKRVVERKRILLNNGFSPRISVASIAKRDLEKGERIERGMGSFVVRGEAVNISKNQAHIPIGLLASARVVRHVFKGDIITFEDVEIPESLALIAWKNIVQNRSIKKERHQKLPLAA